MMKSILSNSSRLSVIFPLKMWKCSEGYPWNWKLFSLLVLYDELFCLKDAVLSPIVLASLKVELNPKIKFVLFERTLKITE